jgi:hypothetical protein
MKDVHEKYKRVRTWRGEQEGKDVARRARG